MVDDAWIADACAAAHRLRSSPEAAEILAHVEAKVIGNLLHECRACGLPFIGRNWRQRLCRPGCDEGDDATEPTSAFERITAVLRRDPDLELWHVMERLGLERGEARVPYAQARRELGIGHAPNFPTPAEMSAGEIRARARVDATVRRVAP